MHSVPAGAVRGFPNFHGLPLGNAASMDHIVTQLMEAHQPAIYATKPDVLAALPRLRVPGRAAGASPQADAGPGAEGGQFAACEAGDPCTVCHDSYEEGDMVVQLPCKHCFHEDCILAWLEVRRPGQTSGASLPGLLCEQCCLACCICLVEPVAGAQGKPAMPAQLPLFFTLQSALVCHRMQVPYMHSVACGYMLPACVNLPFHRLKWPC